MHRRNPATHRKQLNKTRRNKRRQSASSQKGTRLSPVLRVPTPIQTVQTCSFYKSLQLTNVTTAARFLPNGLYDVDPVVGSTTAVGATEWFALYNRYQVLKYTVVYEFLNQDVLGAELNIVNTNTDPGATNTNYASYARNAYGRHVLLGSVNSMNRATITQTFATKQILGGYQSLDTLTGTPTSNPTNVIFTGVGLSPTPVGAMSIGVTVVITVNMLTRFYERKPLTA